MGYQLVVITLTCLIIQSLSSSSSSSSNHSRSSSSSSSSSRSSSSSSRSSSKSSSETSHSSSKSSSSSSHHSSSMSSCEATSCGDCFNLANCTWNYANASCASGPAGMLPPPFDMEIASEKYCPQSACFNDFAKGQDLYGPLQEKFWNTNMDILANYTTCLDNSANECPSPTWVYGNYSSDCNSYKKISSDACKFQLDFTKDTSGSFLRRLLSSSSSSSPNSSSSSSSRKSPSSSSSSSSSSRSNRSSSVSSSSLSSSSLSSSSQSSSDIPSSSSMKHIEWDINYCIPVACDYQAFQDLLVRIYEIKTKFNSSAPSVTTNKKSLQCTITPTNKPSTGGLSGGAIAGIVIGCLVGVLLIGFLGWNMCGKKDPTAFQAM